MLRTLKTDRNRDEAFDRITALVRDIFNVEISAISLIEGERQRFRSIQGLDVTEIPLEASFCRSTWREGTTVILPDTLENDEFRDHALVKETGLRFYAGVVLRTGEGMPIGTICAIDSNPRDFTEREMRVLENLALIASNEFQLREFAHHDALTGALTRRHFMHETARLCEIAARKKLPITVIILDVDHFKSVNDQFGHASGDEVLRSLAAACTANLREYDLVGRMGGEEFAIAVEGSPEDGARTAERLRRAISRLQFTFDEAPCGSPQASASPRSTRANATSPQHSPAPTRRSTRPKPTAATGWSSASDTGNFKPPGARGTRCPARRTRAPCAIAR